MTSRPALPRGRWPTIGPETWRGDLLRITLRFLSVLGALVCVPSVVMSVKTGLYGLAALDTGAMVALLALTYFDQLPTRLRALGCCLVLYALGAGLMVSVGSISQIYLFAFSLLTTLLLTARWGLATVALNVVTMLAVGGLGIMAPDMVLAHWSWSLGGWLVITANFAMVNAMLVLVLGAVIGALESALARAVADRAGLEHERQELERLNAALALEVAQRARSEESLRDSRALLRIAGLTARLGGWRLGVADARVEWSDEVCALHEVPTGTSPTLAEALAFFAPEARPDVTQALEGCLQQGTPFDLEAELVGAKGTRLWVRVIGHALRDASGALTQVHGSIQDITPQKLAEVERGKLEEQLRQAQKMETVGRLAGGVAHDFNNLLSIVLSYSQLLADEAKADDPRRVDLLEIRDAGRRAADLTRQLLAFSRKQVLEPRRLDLSQSVGRMEKMLRRLIGENIELRVACGQALPDVLVDPGQMEQVIMNLAVNAADAMPQGGTLTIATSEVVLDARFAAEHLGVSPGPHVRLTVSDTGLGMDPATQARIFEPFFTTKEEGKGTGLGLATVFGIVEQSGGTIAVTSQPGKGSTFTLSFPIASGQPSAQVVALAPEHGTLRGTETILVVEDEARVRLLTRAILTRYGYTVLEAQNGDEALRLCEQHARPIDLLLTDVVMPRMGGLQLSERLRASLPGLKVIFMSGYSDDAVLRHGLRSKTLAVIQKPITPEPLARKIRAVLDA